MPSLPYALAPLTFPFRHLAAHAGRAGLGGGREVALGCFMAARLAAERLSVDEDGAEGRSARSIGARSWLGAITIPPAVRGHLTRCMELSADAPAETLASEVRALATAAMPWLDAGSRAELDALAAHLSRQGGN